MRGRERKESEGGGYLHAAGVRSVACMSLLPAINREAWRIKGATGLQYHHVERTWQGDRELPDRSGRGPSGYSENPCPLARMRIGRAPPKTPPPPDLPVGAVSYTHLTLPTKRIV